MAKLGDVCEIVSGSTPKTNNESFWNGDFCWITPAEISDSDVVIYDTERKITEMGVNSCALTLMPIGTVLLSSRAPIGKVAITGKEMYCNQGFKNLICSDSIFNKYLFYFLKNNNKYLNSLGRGATFKEISKKIVSDIEIPLPTLETQRQIASNLDKVTHTIDLCNAILEKLDLLVKSRFVEMFGDPETNPKRWRKLPLSDIIINANNGMSRRGNDSDGNIVLRLVELQDGYIDYSNPNKIELSEAEKKRYHLIDKDFLFARVNGNPDNVGRCAVFYDIGEPVFHNDHIIRVHFDETLLDGCFASSLFNSVYGKLQMKAQIKTSAGQYTISQDGIGAIVSILPPLDLQQQFAAFVEQTDKSKLAVKQVLEKAETLKKALMQEYFG